MVRCPIVPKAHPYNHKKHPKVLNLGVFAIVSPAPLFYDAKA